MKALRRATRDEYGDPFGDADEARRAGKEMIPFCLCGGIVYVAVIFCQNFG